MQNTPNVPRCPACHLSDFLVRHAFFQPQHEYLLFAGVKSMDLLQYLLDLLLNLLSGSFATGPTDCAVFSMLFM